MDDALLPIGMFSRASSLSVKTLRAYHEGGLLVPAQVDPRTGYRNYTVDQLVDAAIIVRLRALDLPLEQVAEVLRHRDPEHTRQILAAHHTEMQIRLEETERIVAELQSDMTPDTHTPVHVRYDEALLTVARTRTVTGDELWDWLDATYLVLGTAIDRAGGTTSGARGACYGAEIDEDNVEDVEAFIPIASSLVIPPAASDVGISEVPAGWVAVLVHTGSYDTILDTYRTLGAWVARHGEHGGARVRERYLVGSAESADTTDFRTEIAWPIRPPT